MEGLKWEDIKWEEEVVEEVEEVVSPERATPTIQPDKAFLKEIEQKKTGTRPSKGIKEILMVKESQLPLVSIYLNKLGLSNQNFVYYENMGYKRIASLRENLLNEPYWVIASHGKLGGVKPPKLSYDDKVLDDYLNHVIITMNWGLMEHLNKEDYSVELDFNGNPYKYKVVFASSMDTVILKEYIRMKLSPIMEPMELERVEELIMRDKKKVTDWVDKFLEMAGYSFEDVVERMNKENFETIGRLVKELALKKDLRPRKHVGKREYTPHWAMMLSGLLETRNENYVLTALRNSVSDLLKIKQGKKEVKSLNKKYIEGYIQEVDRLDLILLSNILESKDLPQILVMLDRYMETPTTELILKGGRYM